MDNNLKTIFDICPYSTEFSNFQQENFQSSSASGYARYIIGLINRHRKITSDLEAENKTFESQILIEERNKIVAILSAQDQEKMVAAVANWEKYEAEYWVDTLGKIAAIEILTQGSTSYDTMMKMVKLPEDLYIRATQICVKLANTVKEATVTAEEAIGVNVPFDDELEPKKLILKKTK